MSNAVGQVFGQIFAEIAARMLVGAIEAGFRSAVAPTGPGIPPEKILVQFPATIEVGGDDARVGHECSIDEGVPGYAFNSLSARGLRPRETRNSEGADPASLLRLVIADIQSQGRTDRPRVVRRSITVRAELVQGGAVVSSKEFRHSSSSTSPDTCRVMDRIARPIGKDAAKWAQVELNARGRPPAGRPTVASVAQAPAGIETIAIQMRSVDTSETDPTAALVAELHDGLVARHFTVRPLDEADALLVVRHDSNEGRATTVDLTLIERATGSILWTGRSTNGQLSAAAAKWAAEAAMRTMPARGGERGPRPATSSVRPGS